MDFILTDAIEEDNYKIVFSDESEREYSEEEEQLGSFIENNEDKMFVCNKSSDEDREQDASFYRSLNNKKEFVKFQNQTRNVEEVVEKEDFFGEDDMPELFDPVNRKEVEFDSFDKSQGKSQAFKNSLLSFTDVENHFFMLFTALCTINLTDKMFYLKKPKKL